MTVHIDSLDVFISRSGLHGNSMNNQAPIKRIDFFDYFPHLKENYKGFIAQDTFKSKMQKAVKQAIESTGKLNDRYTESPPQSKPISPICKGSKSDFLDKKSEGNTIRNYYYDLKLKILDGIFKEEWRQMNEMHTSENMYAQSNAYFKSAGMDAGIGIATFGIGKGIGKLAKLKTQKIHSIVKKRTSIGLISGGIYKDTINGNVYDSAFKMKFARNMKSNNSLGKEINPLNIFKGENIMSNASYIGMDVVDINLSNVTQKIWEHNINEYRNHLGVSDLESFNCMDYGLESKTAQNINKWADIVTDFIPFVGLAKTITNVGFNTVLGIQTRHTAHRMKDMDDANNVAEINFNQNLKQNIYDDIYALSSEEIKGLIDVLNLTELTES